VAVVELVVELEDRLALWAKAEPSESAKIPPKRIGVRIAFLLFE
jgi:hypothetical protein